MKSRILTSLLALYFSGAAIFAAPAQAKDYTKYSSSVIEFQLKLAKNGNSLAQYKLGTIYETGNGLEMDQGKAIEWYKKSAAKGHRPAQNRLTFLEIQKTGFNKKQHTNWLTEVKSEAASLNADSMILLAELYRNGIGVSKNPKEALKILKRTSAMGHSEVDGTIDAIQAELSQGKAASKRKTSEQKARAKEERKKQQVANERSKKERLARDKERKRLDEQRRQLEAEKRRFADEKQKIEAQKLVDAQKQAEAQKKAQKEKDSGACSGKAARFRTTCR